MTDAAQFAKDFTAGWMAGVAQVLTGQPFDIVKVRLQSQGAATSPFKCASEILKKEGALAFYKGTLSPILGIGLCVSIQFSANQFAQAWFRQKNNSSDNRLPLWQYGVAGSFAGLANSVLSCPVEHFRIRCQVQVGSGTGSGYSGSIDCARKILASNGISGWYKGMTATVPREIIAYGGYFLVYEYLMQKLLQPGQTRKDASKIQVMVCGAAAGYGMWVPTYWIDTVKSKMQADDLKNPKFKNALDCLVKTYRGQGIRNGFFAGFGACMIRAAPVNAFTFLAFEWSSNLMHSI
eukprot:TRINITY_DN67957_c0_g1_i1.p1 TRINITY_DN67957_c0_g1~~TRINITY_DN67957_c0_g1_i1.p1  ORF type:complete len:307 (+),score=44.05 TRINITY_DN67957_c0_g1_i1:45-923(+)